jgi:glyoxalase-like protein
MKMCALSLAAAFAMIGIGGCARHAAPLAPVVPADFDHVIAAVDDWSRGVAALRSATGAELSTGWVAVTGTGGADVGSAARAAILSLGRGRYLELVGPASDRSPVSAADVVFTPYHVPTPIGWAVRTSNVDSARSNLAARGLRPGIIREGERRAPSGRDVRYRTLEGWAGVTTLMPELVEWAAPDETPGDSAPPGCELDQMELVYGAPDSLRARIARAGIHVAVRYGEAAAQGIHLTLRCPTGLIELPLRAS